MRMISKSSAARMLTWQLCDRVDINLFSVTRSSGRHQESVSVLVSDLPIRCSEELSRRWCLSPRRSLNADRVRSSRRATRDRYQDALRVAKTKGPATTPRAIAEPPKVMNLWVAKESWTKIGPRWIKAPKSSAGAGSLIKSSTLKSSN